MPWKLCWNVTSSLSPLLWNLVGQWKINMDEIELNCCAAMRNFLQVSLRDATSWNRKCKNLRELSCPFLCDLLRNFSLNWARNLRNLAISSHCVKDTHCLNDTVTSPNSGKAAAIKAIEMVWYINDRCRIEIVLKTNNNVNSENKMVLLRTILSSTY